MSKLLITGGAGFIGSNLVEAFLGRGDDVRVLDDFSTGRRQNLEQAGEWASRCGGTYELIEGDIRDVEVCRSAMAGVDFVLHLAAIPSVQRSVQNPSETNSVNVTGTLNLLEAARAQPGGVRRFVYTSSSSLYGESETLPKIESMPPAPISPYGLQKLTAESYCRLYHRLYDLPTVALRYFNVFGPRQDPGSEYSAVIPRFVDAISNGRRPTIYGDGEQTRDFTFVSNVVDANRLSCEAGPSALGLAFNIGCGTRISLNDLLRSIGELKGVEVDAEHVAERPGDIRHSKAGIELAEEHLGYRPEVDLLEGLRRTIAAS